MFRKFHDPIGPVKPIKKLMYHFKNQWVNLKIRVFFRIPEKQTFLKMQGSDMTAAL